MTDPSSRSESNGPEAKGLLPTPTVQVTALNVVAVYVSELQRARRFYVEHLGFAPLQDMPPGQLLRAGQVTLYLEPGRAPRPREPLTEPEVAFCVDAGSVLAAHGALAAAGVTLVGELQHFGPDFAFFRIADPDGNLVELAGKP